MNDYCVTHHKKVQPEYFTIKLGQRKKEQDMNVHRGEVVS
jgi:hypothetical protein